MTEAARDYARMMVEDAPCVTLFDNEAKRKARVEHECSYCQGPILPGGTYYRTSYRDDDAGKFVVVKHHTACHLRNRGYDL